MKECHKWNAHRLDATSRPAIVGRCIHIGGEPDQPALYVGLFKPLEPVCTWDLEDGDAQYRAGIADDSLEFRDGSHCLGHLREPAEGLKSRLRVVRPERHRHTRGLRSRAGGVRRRLQSPNH